MFTHRGQHWEGVKKQMIYAFIYNLILSSVTKGGYYDLFTKRKPALFCEAKGFLLPFFYEWK